MQGKTLTLIAVLAIILGNPSGAFGREPDPLFQSNDLLDITLTGPFTTINRERDKEKTYSDTQLTFENQQGSDVRLDVDLQVRGNFRLSKEVCRIAPLRINFDQQQAKGTLFDKQNKLKLVTHCRPGSSRNTNYLLQEYLIYRMFNLLTDYSFSVRLAEVTYVNTEKKSSTMTGYGFFIEHKKRLGKRLGMKPIDLHLVARADLDPRQANLVSTFQFMIGNTDWSVLKGEMGEACCHNAKLLGSDDSKYFPIPYDFDFSGFVNADYAGPSPNIPIKNVRIRYYRGFCELNDLLDGTMDRYRAKRESIYSLFEDVPQLPERTVEKSRRYLDSFYKLIDNPKALARKVGRCR